MTTIDLDGRSLWQVGAGDTERSYGDLCLYWDVMMVGPGGPGPYEDAAYAETGDVRNSIRRFYREAKRGDLVLLRLGTSTVLSVGVIADEAPDWLPAFSDIDGWDLQHVRRVRWLPESGRQFPAKTLGGQVRTFASVGVTAVREWVASLEVEPTVFDRPLTSLPREGLRLSATDLGRRLFVEGLADQRIAELLNAIASLDRVASWYKNEHKMPEGRPSEHETVAYLVLPLLFALGWSQQTAAVEWRNIDVALFKTMPANDKSLCGVVEAKLLGRSVFSPVGQARDYALKLGRDDCGRLIVTDGIRYTVHVRDGQAFRLAAYLNLLDLRETNPVYRCAGAVDALLLMRPGS